MYRLDLKNIDGYYMASWKGFNSFHTICGDDDMPKCIVLNYCQYDIIIYLDRFIGLLDILVWYNDKLYWSNDYL